MQCTFTQLSYGETGYFSNIVDAYIHHDERLKPFYRHPPSLEGIAKAISVREQHGMDRALLVQGLHEQYASLPVTESVSRNIQLLGNAGTFSVCTAHQPAIFTGSLFFVYKILHAIKLAEKLRGAFPDRDFVPVFFMGCEDADLDELGKIFLEGEEIGWNTTQRGAVGRMSPGGLETIIDRVDGELSVHPYGPELVSLLKTCYLDSPDIQTATLKLLNALFGEYGLVVLVPDSPTFKRAMVPVFEDELFNRPSAAIVERTTASFPPEFKMQARPREINLFYLKDDSRERIEKEGERWKVVNTDIAFDAASLKKELYEYPERFSPNVILRGIFQETLLPNVAFIGGGGELAYWMELPEVFDHYKVPFPVLVLRNSFMIIERKWMETMDNLRISIPDIFRDEPFLLNELVKRESDKKLVLSEEIRGMDAYYDRLKALAGQVDDTLTGHVAALQMRAIKPLQELEKKMVRAEKRKFEVQQRQVHNLRNALFPGNSLQERVENFMPFYARWGKAFFQTVYDHSYTLEQRFGVLREK